MACLDFLVFCSLARDATWPEPTAICQFESRPMNATLDALQLAEMDELLVRHGLKVHAEKSAIILALAARASRSVEVDENSDAEVIDSADTDARWIKKGKHAFFDYRAYVAVNTEDGFISAQTPMFPIGFPCRETSMMCTDRSRSSSHTAAGLLCE